MKAVISLELNSSDAVCSGTGIQRVINFLIENYRIPKSANFWRLVKN